MNEFYNKIVKSKITKMIFVIASLIFSSLNSFSFYKSVCLKLAQSNQNIYAYQNSNNEYVPNIQKIEAFKRFQYCQAKDSTVHISHEYDAQLKDLDLELKKMEMSDKNIYNELNQKVNRIFNEIKKTYISVLNKYSRKLNKPSDSLILAQIVQRISTIRLIKSNYCNMFNASYNPLSHSINLCNEVLNYPEATLVSIIGHEMSHSIDPCLLQFSFSQILNSNPFYKNEKLFTAVDSQSAYTTIPFDWAESDFYVEKKDFILLAKEIEFAQNPFQSVLQCLQTKGSIQAQIRQNNLTDSDVEDKEGMCSSSFADGEMQEVFADWMGFEFLAEYLKNKKIEEQRILVFEGALNITANECADLESDIEKNMRESILNSPICKTEALVYFTQVDQIRNQTIKSSHPNGERRINKLFFVQPYLNSIIKLDYKNNDPQSGLNPTYCEFKN